MGRAGRLAGGEGNAARARCPGKTDGQSARRRLAADRRRHPRRSHARGSRRRCWSMVSSRASAWTRSRWPPVGLSGVRPAVRARSGDHALSRRVSDGPSARGDGRHRSGRRSRSRPGPISCCSTAACSSRRHARERLLEVIESWFNDSHPHPQHPPLPTTLAADRPRQRPARSGRRPRRGLLRHGPPRAGRADRRRIGPDVLHRRRKAAGTSTASIRLPLPLALRRLPAARRHRAGARHRADRSGSSTCWSPSRSSFRCYVSSTRLTDKPGELVPIDRERMTPLPPIRTVLKTRRRARPDSRAGASARPADGDRHARSVVQRDRRPAELAAAIRRALGHANRRRGPRVGRRERRLRRRGDLAASARR